MLGINMSGSCIKIMVTNVKYDILQQIGRIEVRRYPSLILAKVDRYGDAGFNILYQYISGSNQKQQQIEMTAPVISQRIPMTTPAMTNEDSIAFVIPEEYTLEKTPRPLDERIQIVKISSRVIAALQFSGRWSQSKYDARSKDLLEELAKYGFKKKGEVFVMRYSGPLTPWFLRKNEVAVEVTLAG